MNENRVSGSDQIKGQGDNNGEGLKHDKMQTGKSSKTIIEALLFVSEHPLSIERIQTVIEGYDRRQLKGFINELIEEYRKRDGAIEIVEVASGYQMRTRSEYSRWIQRLLQKRPLRLTMSSMETLAIIAYKQPVTRAEIEQVRGVDSGGVIGSLLEKRLIRVLGRKDVPGRPILYGTTKEFLEVFGLKDLKSLPSLKEIKEMLKRNEERPDGEDKTKIEKQDDQEEEKYKLMLKETEDVEKVTLNEGIRRDVLDTEEVSLKEMDDMIRDARIKYHRTKKDIMNELGHVDGRNEIKGHLGCENKFDNKNEDLSEEEHS